VPDWTRLTSGATSSPAFGPRVCKRLLNLGPASGATPALFYFPPGVQPGEGRLSLSRCPAAAQFFADRCRFAADGISLAALRVAPLDAAFQIRDGGPEVGIAEVGH